MLIAAGILTLAMAQNTRAQVVKGETTTKKTSSVPQKVHNIFSRDKKYNGKKTKHVRVVKKDHYRAGYYSPVSSLKWRWLPK